MLMLMILLASPFQRLCTLCKTIKSQGYINRICYVHMFLPPYLSWVNQCVQYVPPPTSWFPFPNVQHPFAPFLHIFLMSNLKTSSSPILRISSTILNTSSVRCRPFHGLTGRTVQMADAVSGDLLHLIFLDLHFSFFPNTPLYDIFHTIQSMVVI